MQVDVVMLSKSSSPELIAMTQRAIDSLHESEPHIRFNVHLIESAEYHPYAGAICHTPLFAFNYNAFMNHGLTFCHEDWVVMANNDVVFRPGWFSAILTVQNVAQSFSPYHPWGNWPYPGACHMGYGVGGEVTGWCIVAKRREVFGKIGRLCEDVSFWCSDNVYSDQIRRAGIVHAIVRDSHVEHLGGKTLFTESQERIGELTADQAQIYNGMDK